MNKQKIAHFVAGIGLVGAALSAYAQGPVWMGAAGLALAGGAKIALAFLGPAPQSAG